MCILYGYPLSAVNNKKKKKKVRSLLITIKIRDVREGMINPRCVCLWACVRMHVCARAALAYTPFLPSCPFLPCPNFPIIIPHFPYMHCPAQPYHSLSCLALPRRTLALFPSPPQDLVSVASYAPKNNLNYVTQLC